MNKNRKPWVSLLLCVALLCTASFALSDDYYWGEKDVRLWSDSAYTLTVDKHWDLMRTDLESVLTWEDGTYTITVDHAWVPHELELWNGDEYVLGIGRYFYPLQAHEEAATEAYLRSFAETVLRYTPTQQTRLRLPGVTGYSFASTYAGGPYGVGRHLALISTGKEIIYLFSDLPLDDFNRLVSTFKTNE